MQHLDLEQLAPFAARYLISREVLRSRARSERDRDVLASIRQTADLMPGGSGLQAHFDYLSEYIKTQQAHFAGDISEDFSDALNQVVAALPGHHCGCCSAKNKPCAKGVSTFTNVDRKLGGRCIAPLKRRFAELQRWVQGLVRELPACSSYAKATIQFSTINWNFYDERHIVQKFSVGGYAVSYPLGDGHATRVSLAIRDKSFQWEQFCMLPYVLLHEILCHAFQSLDNPVVRGDAHPADAWSEGWMDRLAFELALEWLKRRQRSLRFSPPEFDDAKQQMRLLHDFRYRRTDLTPPADDEVKSLPEDGRDAFIEVRAKYGEKYGPLSISEHPLTRFSLRLNAITLERKFRVGRVLQAFRYLAKFEPARLRLIVGSFNRELQDGDAVKLLELALP
jgi:hypothetical protein